MILKIPEKLLQYGEWDIVLNKFDKYVIWIFVVIIIVFMVTNILFFSIKNEENKEEIVQVNRIEKELKSKDAEQIDLSQYTAIIQVYALTEVNQEKFFTDSNYDYLIREIAGELYRFDYNAKYNENSQRYLILLNLSLVVISFVMLLVIFLIRHYIIKPFNIILDLPIELAKGNLTAPLKESKSKIFGKFIWGLDLLRENLEATKQKELQLEKEKKTLVLSLSHDIYTPLSAIKLYAKALSINLYDTKEKQLEIAINIEHKADEISCFISEIVNASNEDFLYLEVMNDSFYLKNLIDEIEKYYIEKFDLLKISYEVSSYDNCILYGDFNRSMEVLQNIIENAIKYGSAEYINIEIYAEENCIIICVKNSGCNLAISELKYVFNSFWRGSNADNIKGSGLGLYITKQLMTKMNGDAFAKINSLEMQVSVVFRKL